MIIVLVITLAILFFCIYFAKKYSNPYKLYFIFGKKGSGKSTYLTKKAIQYIKKGKKVYSTTYVPGAYQFDVNLIGTHTFLEDSVIFIDEVGMIWDNRDYKNFRQDVRDYFKMQRQYRNIVYLFSQTFDVDVKLRNLTDSMYLCTCHMNFISVARKIKRDITITAPTGDSESRIADSLEFQSPLWSLFGAKTIVFTFIPRWTKYFKSFNPPELPFVEGDLCS